MKRVLLYFIFLWETCNLVAQPLPDRYRMFDNIGNKTETFSVRCFAQDASGMLWLGTIHGLYSYDGYNIHYHSPQQMTSRLQVYCSLTHDHILFLGCENGLWTFNLNSGEFTPLHSDFHENVRALLKVGHTIYIGTETGLYAYDIDNDIFTRPDISDGTLPDNIFSLACIGKYLFVGTMRELGCYHLNNHTYEQLITNSGILAMQVQNDGCGMWIGTDKALLKLDLDMRVKTVINDLPVVKSLALDDDDNLLIGTDAGLYIRTENGKTHHIVRDSRKPYSIVNDVIWNIYPDKNGNIWLGTNNGVSISAYNKRMKHFALDDITGIGRSNQLFCLFRSKDEAFWIAGSHGAIRIENMGKQDMKYYWYHMDSKEFPINHNRIRKIYEDNKGRLWLATDVGLMLYDSSCQQFKNYKLSDVRANWIYDICSDKNDNFWLATLLGIYFWDTESLTKNDTLVPQLSFTREEGLFDNNTYKVAMDCENNLWVLAQNQQVDYINLKTHEVQPLQSLLDSPSQNANNLQADQKGRIWVTEGNKLLCITPDKGRLGTRSVCIGDISSMIVHSMTETDDEMCLSTSEGIYGVNKETLVVWHVPTKEKYTSIYYDWMQNKLWLGATDKLLMFDHTYTDYPENKNEIRVTNVLINGKKELSYKACRKEDIVFESNDNNLTISFSDCHYSSDEGANFSYHLEGLNSGWIELMGGENRIVLSELQPGKYKLFVKNEKQNATFASLKPVLNFTIRSPWYFTPLAKCIYAFIFLGIVWWTFNFFWVRKRLILERKQRKLLVSQAQSKMQFFTNIAHEFKTPLSLILAPAGKLLSEKKESEERNLLEMIYSNAIRLSSLIQFSIEAYQDDSKAEMNFIVSEVEFVEFSRCIFESYQDNPQHKDHNFVFSTNCDKINLKVDISKMESVINNLLANSCKYTPTGGSIILSLEYIEEQACMYIKVSDTGIGIPQAELPYIFQRFYQSSRTSGKGFEGTGVGLSIVKDYVEIHGGYITVGSDNNGSTFTVKLPVAQSDYQKNPFVSVEAETDNRPLIVVVEDNVSTANFIRDLLKKEYRCQIAHNGKNGLKLCLDLQPSLIITDAMMPVMDGLEMCRKIRQSTSLATTPIILLTAKKDTQIECQSAMLNIDAFISKPFEHSLLQARIAQLLEIKKRFEHQVRIENISQPQLKGEISSDEKFLLKITRIIESHLNDPDLSVELLCQLSNISSKQLYRKIKQLTNRSTVEYIRSIRLKKAAVLFNNGNFTVAEVMYMVGFSNASYFTRSFKSEFGCTPLEYLNKNKTDNV